MKNLTYTFSPEQASMLSDALALAIITRNSMEDQPDKIDLWPINRVTDLKDDIDGHKDFVHIQPEDIYGK